MLAHKRDHTRFVNAELNLNRLKWCAVFPRHLHDTVSRCHIQHKNLFFHANIISDEVQFAIAEII